MKQKMKLIIKNIALHNFRCFDDLSVELNEGRNAVYGDNETGKSTIASAILWCLTGKDVEGNSTFEIVKQGKYGTESAYVQMECLIDDAPATLKREYSLKQARDKSFLGYETKCYVNNIEKSIKKFQAYIDEKICNEVAFKILINPYTFLEHCPKESKELAWQAQRRLLITMAHVQSDKAFATRRKEWANISGELARYDTTLEYRQSLKSERTRLQKAIDNFEPQIEQQEKNCNEVDISRQCAEDYIKAFKQELSEEEENYKRDIALHYQDELANYYKEKDSLNDEANKAFYARQGYIDKQAHFAEKQEELEERLENFNEYCPTCKQPLTLQISKQWKDELKNRIKLAKSATEDMRKEAENANNIYQEKAEQLSKLQMPVFPKQEDDQIKHLRQSYATKIADCEAKLRQIEINEKSEQLIRELEVENKSNIKKLSAIQQKMDECDKFISARCKASEKKINSLFETVKFVLFEKNKTNDEIQEVCEMTYNGHKYADLSASTKLIANLEILKAFQKYYNATVPLIVDNKESITADLDANTQVIELYVREERCPKCGGASDRRQPDGNWKCQSCGNEWVKSVKINPKEAK